MIRRVSTALVVVLSVYMLAGCDFPTLPDRGKDTSDKEPVYETISFSVAGAVNPGEQVNLNDYEGKVVLLDFRTTWSDACDADLPMFNRLQNDYRDQGVVVIGLMMDDPVDEQVAEYLQSRGVTYPCGVAASVLSQPPFNRLRVIPTRYLLNRDHRLSGEPIIGEVDEYALRKRIEQLL